MFPRKLSTSIAIGVAVISIAFAGYTIAKPNSSNGASGAANRRSAVAHDDGTGRPRHSACGNVT